MPGPDMSRVTDCIESLYREAGADRPHLRQPIVPLARLIGGLDLCFYEIADLTMKNALQLLVRKGALMDSPAEPQDVPLSGFICANRNGGCLIVRGNDPVARRRFSAAHELAHYLLHFRLTENKPSSSSTFMVIGEGQEDRFSRHAQSKQMKSTFKSHSNHKAMCCDTDSGSMAESEEEADSFAAELLMPAGVVTDVVSAYRDGVTDFDLVGRLSSDFLVSRLAMHRRLMTLGLIAPDTPEY